MKTIAFLFLICFVCCNSPQRKEENGKHIHNISLSVSTFDHIPEDIEGCCCTFFLKNIDKNRKYIFVNDFANIGYAYINSNIVKFSLQQTSKDNKVFYYSAKDFNAILKIRHKVDSGPESSDIVADLIISSSIDTNQKQTLRVVGTCGC